MVERLQRWFRSWLVWHHIGFHDFGFAFRTVHYIDLSFDLAYHGRDLLRELSLDYDVCDTCSQVRKER